MVLLLAILFSSLSAMNSDPICDALFLQSFGLQGRTKPVKVNSLCPSIENNCCTNEDVILLYKTWNN